MKSIKDLVTSWFNLWEKGAFEDLPLSPDFRHTSPFGTIEGKETYLELVRSNRDKFLGYHFEIQDTIYEKTKAAIRYVAVQDEFRLEVSEWHYAKDDKIMEIIAYYHIGEIRDERKLKGT